MSIEGDVAAVGFNIISGGTTEIGSSRASFSIDRDDGGNGDEPLTVLLIVAGSVDLGTDYTASGLTPVGGLIYSANILAGTTSTIIEITAINDGLEETEETQSSNSCAYSAQFSAGLQQKESDTILAIRLL